MKKVIKKKHHPKTAAEEEYHNRVAQLPCAINNEDCNYRGRGTVVHHKTGAGMSLRSSHYLVMPLCFNHHDAQTPLKFGHSVHKGTRSFEANYRTQDEMIAETYAALDFTPPEDEE